MMRNAMLRGLVLLGLLAVVAAPPAVAQSRGTVHVVQPGETLFSIARQYGITVAQLMAMNDIEGDTIFRGQRLRVGPVPRSAEPSPSAPGTNGAAEDQPRASAPPEEPPEPGHGPVGPLEDTTLPEVPEPVPPPEVPATMSRVVLGPGGGAVIGRPVAADAAPASIHVVQAGETLFTIARRYGTTVDEIRQMNRLRGDLIEVGQELAVSAGAAPAPAPAPAPVAIPQPRYVITRSTAADDEVHVTRPGETLYSIARRYGTSVSRLLAVNTVTTAPLEPGTVLALPDSVGIKHYRAPAPPPPADEAGLALVYAESYRGRETISGEPYDPAQLTASHRTHPFGTILEVTVPATEKRVLVRINDRGPVSEGFLVELSDAAAQALGIRQGSAERVELRVVR